ncbi:OsmC family protein [Paraoerskovia sediminicola]|uniref:OsmC family protein n=1 Tax=Paraoerskovia sediminicola TaxID=1138587 RepID=UPI003306239F
MTRRDPDAAVDDHAADSSAYDGPPHDGPEESAESAESSEGEESGKGDQADEDQADSDQADSDQADDDDSDSDSDSDEEITPSSAAPTDALWVERTGGRTYRGHSERGASVEIGPASEGAVFTPGELLKLALAACAGMSSDVTFARRLGDDYTATIRVDGTKDLDDDRYPTLSERFEVDLSSLDEAARERLLTVAERAIDKTCTVGNTLKAGAKVDLSFVDSGAAED